MNVKSDCRRYRVSVPCQPHKQRQARCDECVHYDAVSGRILIVKLDAMGDVLRTTSCLEPVKRLYPHSHITWITRTNGKAVLEGNPWIDRILEVERNYLEFVLSERFDLALGPDADLLSATIMTLATADEKRGFISDGNGGVVPLNEAAEHWWRMGLDDTLKRENRRTYGEWLYAICELPLPVARPWLRPSDGARARADRLIRSGAPAATRVVCFNTGAGPRWQEKRWRLHHFRALATTMAEREPSTAVVLVGGPDEAAFNAELLASCPALVDGGTGNSIEAFAAIVASSDWMLTGDSLGYHVACAVGTPTVCLAGPTSPWELDRYGTNRILHADLDCIACYLPKCPLAVTCMDALTPWLVWPEMDGGAVFLEPRPGVVMVRRPVETRQGAE
jgi:ADP-heptose:LPS heptosyltransferase